MPNALTPAEIFDRAADEGQRRLDQSLTELVSTGFIAGFTIVFGIVAHGIVHAAVEPRYGDVARVAAALAFAPGLVFLVMGRAELFTENFFDPVATLVERRERRMVGRLLRLWGVTFVLNLIGGALLALPLAVPGVLPHGTTDAVIQVAEEIVAREAPAGFVSAVIGGALVALLSYLLQAVDGMGSRIAITFFVGFMLAVGPFDHVIVTALHVIIGMTLDATAGYGDLARVLVVSTAGNLVGGIGLVTLSHAAQAMGSNERKGRERR